MNRILVVDDENISRVTMTEILRLEGYQVDSANSGEEAVQRLLLTPYDLLLLDLRMPGMGGMGVMRTTVDSFPDMKVIVMTAYGSLDSAIQALRYRAYDYLLKPISPENVVRSVRNAFTDQTPAVEIDDVEKRSEPTGQGRSLVFRVRNGVVIDCVKRTVVWGGQTIYLTPTEARLMGILFDRYARVVTHTELVVLTQGYQVDREEAAKILRPVMSRLRHKLTVIPGAEDWIRNVRGSGYIAEIDYRKAMSARVDPGGSGAG
jgi:DNA-binding response OmpR family regulator